MSLKKIFIHTLICCTLLVKVSPVFSAILFQDNFDDSPDWQSQETVNRGAGGTDVTWSMTRSDSCTDHCPPQGWTSYRAAGSIWYDDRGKDTFILSAAGARGGSGKGITYNVECSGAEETSWGKWVGGSLDIWLGEEGYSELYVRFYLKYDTNWKWAHSSGMKHAMQKMLRMSTFNDNIWTSSISPHAFFGDGLNYPGTARDWYHNSASDTTFRSLDLRLAPDYDSSQGPDEYYDVLFPEDNNWHSYEFGIKMNSAPGVADGGYVFYLDGIKKFERTDLMWKKAGSNTTHNWNWIMLLDNVNISAYLENEHKEMSIYMDDVVVSTEYIGTDDLPPTKTLDLAPPTF